MSTNKGKKPGKTQWAGRRRPMTRKAGFTSHPDTTGREFKVAAVGGYSIRRGKTMRVIFHLPQVEAGRIIGFGAWYMASPGVRVTVTDSPAKYRLTGPEPPNWNCVGSQWYSDGSDYAPVVVTFTAGDRAGKVALWDAGAGGIAHAHLDNPPRDGLMGNMHTFAPEANFYTASESGPVEVEVESGVREVGEVAEIVLKACNRCARFLPINIENERHHLSFTNHCTAESARPCKHATFGKLRNIDTGEILNTDCGFQLECRICKKFQVNAPHNPQRSAAQMKEDGARRRAFELLLTGLYGDNPSLRYRERTGGRELTDDVYEAFDGRCFKCQTALATPNDMQLDHTRPLALLWPLDGTATALCVTCNSTKRDRPPVDFYSHDELVQLAELTRIPLDEIMSPDPNLEAIRLLRDRLDWFFEVFLMKPELQEERDGKIAADLLVKALQKAIDAAPRDHQFSILEMSEDRRGKMPEAVGDEAELI